MDQFFSGCIIHDTDKCVGYLSEILSSDICIVDRYGKCDTFDVGWNLCQIDHDLFVIAFSGTGQIVAHMFDTSGRMFQISVKDKFFFGRHLPFEPHINAADPGQNLLLYQMRSHPIRVLP